MAVNYGLLLLSSLLLSRGAAECTEPPPKDHLVLTNESLLKNDFPEGTEVTFTCTNGYESHNGSGSITCIGAQWTEPELLCKKKDCGHPRASPNMVFTIDDGTLFTAKVKLSCTEGYMLNGSPSKQCYAGGWIGRAKCLRIFCNLPSKVKDGQHTWVSSERPTYGDTVQYNCDPGFILLGDRQRRCQGLGVFDSPAPMCEGPNENSTTTSPATVSITASTPTSVQGGKYELVTTDKDNLIGSEGSTLSNIWSSVAPGESHGANTGMTTTHEHPTPPTQSGPAAGVTTCQPHSQGEDKGELETSKDTGYTVVIISVISAVIVVLLVMTIIYRFLRRRRGSYDTQEDLKPELLQFQSL